MALMILTLVALLINRRTRIDGRSSLKTSTALHRVRFVPPAVARLPYTVLLTVNRGEPKLFRRFLPRDAL